MRRRRWLVGLVLVAACGGSTGCSTMNNTQAGALGGGIIGAAAGTIVGAATGNPKTGAVVGTLAGAGIGGLVGHEHDKAEARQAKAVADYHATHPPTSIGDVLQMTRDHISPDTIIRQIQATNSYYNLTAPDITMLRQNGVSESVVNVMIARRSPGPMVMHPRPVYVVEPAPPPVAVGVGFGFSSGPRCRRW